MFWNNKNKICPKKPSFKIILQILIIRSSFFCAIKTAWGWKFSASHKSCTPIFCRLDKKGSDVICGCSLSFILIFHNFWIKMKWRTTFRHAATIKLTSWTFNLANWQPCSRRLQWVPGSSWVHLPQIIFINMMPVAYSRTTSWLWSDYTFFSIWALCAAG